MLKTNITKVLVFILFSLFLVFVVAPYMFPSLFKEFIEHLKDGRYTLKEVFCKIL